MGNPFKLTIARAAELREAAQEQLGRELLDRIEKLTQLMKASNYGRALATTSSAVSGFAGCQVRQSGVRILIGRGLASVEK
jgi:hypothetical protein